MKYLKKFENNSSYEEYILSEDSILPNVSYTVDTNEVFYNPLISNPSLYEFVDLGLPSGLKWATCNVGATKPEEYGLYFAWGETQGYRFNDKTFYWGDYKLCDGSSSKLTKYNNNSSYGTVDNLTVLEQADDAAYQSDNACIMPTSDKYQELIDNTTSTRETLNGVNGMRFTSNMNGNSIFFPASGYYYDGTIYDVDSVGALWSSSLNSSNPIAACCLRFDSSGATTGIGPDRCYGLTVRAVKE